MWFKTPFRIDQRNSTPRRDESQHGNTFTPCQQAYVSGSGDLSCASRQVGLEQDRPARSHYPTPPVNKPPARSPRWCRAHSEILARIEQDINSAIHRVRDIIIAIQIPLFIIASAASCISLHVAPPPPPTPTLLFTIQAVEALCI